MDFKETLTVKMDRRLDEAHEAAARLRAQAEAFQRERGAGISEQQGSPFPPRAASMSSNLPSRSFSLGFESRVARLPSLNMQQQLSSPGGGGGAPFGSPASMAELRRLQQQLENSQQLQRMRQASLGLGSVSSSDISRRRSSMSEASTGASHAIDLLYTAGLQAAAAEERLRKKRRVITTAPIATISILSSKKGNSFPMPPLEGQEPRRIDITSMDSFQQLWDQSDARSKHVFPRDVEKQKQYVKWRFASSLGGLRIL